VERVSVRGVTKRFDSVVAVDDVTLACEEGEFLVLLGPSGSGKTTLLRLIAGLEEVTAGEIVIAGRNVTQVPPMDRDIAMVFQNYALYPHMTVRKNLQLALRQRRIPREVIEARTAEVASLLQIDGLLGRLPRQLSGGQQQRVAVGRAIMREPKVFLMDEPLSNLDARLRMDTRRELITLQRRLSGTFIYVTHDQNEAMTMGTRIVVMNHGVIQQQGSPIEIFRNPANMFVAAFIGETKMNFLPAKLIAKEGDFSLRGEGFELSLSGQALAVAQRGTSGDLVVGVRPEHISVGNGEDGVLRAKVVTFEVMGSRALLTVARENGDLMSVEVPSLPHREPGEVLALTMNWDELHLFDAVSELALGQRDERGYRPHLGPPEREAHAVTAS
jgi:multiple sugar transport system ATP-binding protein